MLHKREVDLVVIPVDGFDWSVLGVDDDAPTFGDNGGDPDGKGPYLRPANEFGKPELARVIANGAELAHGYEINYLRNYDQAQQSDLAFSGYQAEGVAYCLDGETADKLNEMSGETAETYIEDRLTDDDIEAWHEGNATDHVRQLMKEAGVECIEIYGDKSSQLGHEVLNAHKC